jgi:hypothetical protein
MRDLITVAEATARFPLGERRIRQLCSAGLGRRHDGVWLVSSWALARHLPFPASEPPTP